MAYGYTGQPLDANGLAYHRARFYDPSLGVWNSQDPLELMNRYGYVDGNPITMVDRSGHYGESNNVSSCQVQEIGDCENLGFFERMICRFNRSVSNSETQLPPLGITQLPPATVQPTPLNTIPPVANTPTPNYTPMPPTATPPPTYLFGHAPVSNCQIIRDYAAHTPLQPGQEGVDVINSVDLPYIDLNSAGLTTNPDSDSFSRQSYSIVNRTVQFIADGYIVGIFNDTSVVSPGGPAIDSERNSITIWQVNFYALSESPGEILYRPYLIQYTHVFPAYPPYPNLDIHKNDPQTARNEIRINPATGLTINSELYQNEGDILGFYAQTGRASIGPHLHISVFVGPAIYTNDIVEAYNIPEFENWLNAPTNLIDPDGLFPCP